MYKMLYRLTAGLRPDPLGELDLGDVLGPWNGEGRKMEV